MKINSTAYHDIETPVILNFFNCGRLMFGFISGVKYTDYGKVLYDITLYPFKNEPDNKEIKTIIKEVDSYFVEKIQPLNECN